MYISVTDVRELHYFCNFFVGTLFFVIKPGELFT
jgi:hypothetical protein